MCFSAVKDFEVKMRALREVDYEVFRVGKSGLKILLWERMGSLGILKSEFICGTNVI